MELRSIFSVHVLAACVSSFGVLCITRFTFRKEHLNRRLIGYTIASHVDFAMAQCTQKCMLIKQCASVNYCKSMLTCELNALDSDNAESTEFVKDNNWNYADNTTWPKVMAGTCENNNCGQNQECLPIQPEAICVSLPGNIIRVSSSLNPDETRLIWIQTVCNSCPSLQPIGHSKLKPGGTLANTTRTYTCDAGYMAIDGAPTIEKVCQSDGKWTNEGYICYAQISQWVKSVASFSSEYEPIRFCAAQVIGVNDTYPAYGDIQTSWAPRIIDANQFLEVNYEIAVFITGVDIYETFNSGGVKRVSARDSSGSLHVLWETTTVTAMASSRIFSPSLQVVNYRSSRIRVDVDCSVANNWVEIDAIRLHGRQ